MATFVKGNAVANATSYELFEKSGTAYNSLATGGEINFEVSALGLAAGAHTLVVKAKAAGYDDSPYSNEVTYTVEDSSGAGDGGDDVYSSGTLTLHQGALSVVSGEAGQVTSSNKTRMTSASTETANGILVPAGKTITLTGLAPDGQNALRFDCLWAKSAGPNPAYSSISGNWSELVKTDSNFVSSNYFPHNTSGEDTCSVTNNESEDYYVFFGFAGPNKTETVLVANYTITYVVQ